MISYTEQIILNDMKPDGALRDIYVEDTTLKDWDLFIKGILNEKYKFMFYPQGSEVSINTIPSIQELFNNDPNFIRSLLVITVGSFDFNCHFFTEEEIELDLEPRQLKSEKDILDVIEFMTWIGLLLNKEVIFCYENMKRWKICHFSPNSNSFLFRV